MKKNLLLFSLCCSTICNAANHYFSNNGNDLADGLTIQTPQQSIKKLNASFASYTAGDSILFKSGDTFYGTIIINKAGANGNAISISKYGAGNNPLVTGFTTISDWVNEGNGIYSKVISSEALTNMVVIDGVQYAMGRYPDAGYLTFQAASANTTIITNALPANNWQGAEVVIRKNDWTLDRCLVTNNTADQLTYKNLGSSQDATKNFGFFIQNDLRCLTKYGEWYHDINTGKFYMYFGKVNPGTKKVQVATVNNLLYNRGNYDYITVKNIDFTGSIENMIFFSSTNNYCTIQNCTLSFVGKAGIYLTRGVNTIIDNNNVMYCNRTGISSDATTTTISNNNISQVGTFAGQAFSSGYEGIYTLGNGVIIKYNTIKNTGYNGISLKYFGAATIQYNFLDSLCTVLDDGGGIYTSGQNNSVREIDYNIILDVIGNSAGTNNSHSISAGIYLDESASNAKVTNNTIANITYAGIKIHKSNTNVLKYNTVYNTGQAVLFQNNATVSNIYNNTMVGNKFIAKKENDVILNYQSGINDINNFTTADSNVYAKPTDDKKAFSVNQPSNSEFKNLDQLKTFNNQDVHSKKRSIGNTEETNFLFKYNASKMTKVILLGDGTWSDFDDNLFKGQYSLKPWSSIILFKKQ